MVITADTGPLNYLLLVGAADGLAKVYDKLLLPTAVRNELRHPKAPPEVRIWSSHLPAWVEVATPSAPDFTLRLENGEREAIALAQQFTTAILIDDGRGRRIASSKGLLVIGTVGFLEIAAARDLLGLEQALTALGRTSHRHSPELIKAALERDRGRKRGGS